MDDNIDTTIEYQYGYEYNYKIMSMLIASYVAAAEVTTRGVVDLCVIRESCFQADMNHTT